MANYGIFPTADADFNIYINNANTYLNTATVKTRLVTTPTAVGSLTQVSGWIATATIGWNALYPQSQNPALRTKTITDSKNALRKQIETGLRTVYDDIPKSILSQTDRDTLNLSLPSTSGTPNPVPTSRPVGSVDTSQRLQHTISFVDSDTPTSRAKPDGVRGCQIWIKIGSPVSDSSELTFVATDTKSPYVMHFEGADATKNAYYWLRWENTRGEVGPWSDVVMATIPA
jgi:hypothetical protein